MIEKIINYKKNLEEVKNSRDPKTTNINKSDICQILIMANLAEMCIRSDIKVPKEDRNYFEGQAFVGRYFDDWGLPWVGKEYLDIVKYIKENYW
jgi:hypothetical protein